MGPIGLGSCGSMMGSEFWFIWARAARPEEYSEYGISILLIILENLLLRHSMRSSFEVIVSYL